MFPEVVYAIWQERNSRIFKARARNECIFINDITFYVSARPPIKYMVSEILGHICHRIFVNLV